MTSKYSKFIFESYEFDASSKTLHLQYSFDGEAHFTESYRFDFDFVNYNPQVLDTALQNLFLMAGVSYFKAYVAPEIVIKKGTIDEQSAAFFAKTWQRGLGEFFYANQLDPRTEIYFPAAATNHQLQAAIPNPSGLLIGIGGGKDSLVSVELLRDNIDDLATWSVGHRPQLTPLIERIGLPHYWVERGWDRSLLEHYKNGALNGHIPISAILACVGSVTAVLSGRRDVVVSNEQSANEPTLHYEGLAINHQYSKSQEFERDFQAQLARTLGDQVRYYSLLRPLSEVRIAEIFRQVGFDKYHDVFSSCNRAFTHESDRMFWDGTCPKCAFVFMALTPFVPREKLEVLFSGKNLLLDPDLEPTYRSLLGIEGDKPLECVGEIKESREAMHLSFKIYPELGEKYQFELPDDYDFRTVSTNEMPPEVYELILTYLTEHKQN